MKFNREQLKDINRRKNFLKIEYRKLILKSLIEDNSLPTILRIQAKQLYHTTSLTQIRARCSETGRTRGIVNKLWRVIFRRKATEGLLPGIRKST